MHKFKTISPFDKFRLLIALLKYIHKLIYVVSAIIRLLHFGMVRSFNITNHFIVVYLHFMLKLILCIYSSFYLHYPFNNFLTDEELLLQCRWHNCCQSFPNYIRLHVHFLECHLNNVPELVCLWDSCQKNDIFQEQNQLLRHTLLHIFFEDCIVNTNKLLKAHHKAWNFVCCGISCQKPAYLQRSTETFLWNTIILNRGFECQWKDCDYT